MIEFKENHYQKHLSGKPWGYIVYTFCSYTFRGKETIWLEWLKEEDEAEILYLRYHCFLCYIPYGGYCGQCNYMLRISSCEISFLMYSRKRIYSLPWAVDMGFWRATKIDYVGLIRLDVGVWLAAGKVITFMR